VRTPAKPSLGGLASQALFAVFTVRRLRDARRTGDRWDVVDAVANVLVLVTGTIVLVREMRNRRSHS